MDAIFKQYGVCEDIADMIAKKVHIGFQSKLNDHISVIIKWDTNFDYWTFGRYRTSNLFYPKVHTDSSFSIPENLNRYKSFMNLLFSVVHAKKYSKKITGKEYLSYVLSNKKVFRMDRPIRWNQFVFSLNRKYKAFMDDIQTDPSIARNMSSYVLPMTHLVTNSYKKELETIETDRVFNMVKDPATLDPITLTLLSQKHPSYKFKNSKNTILKTELISYLNRNGNPRKLTNKTKKELWKMIFEMKC